MTNISALNNSSVGQEMDIDTILEAAEARLRRINGEAETTKAEQRPEIEAQWRSLLETARGTLPPAIKPYVHFARHTVRDDYPSKVAVAIDLPDCERIFYGPWDYNKSADRFEIADPWRNTPFEVGGGNKEEFGDLLDAIARAREVRSLSETR